MSQMLLKKEIVDLQQSIAKAVNSINQPLVEAAKEVVDLQQSICNIEDNKD